MQLSYNINQPIGIEGSLGEIEDNWVRSYINGTSVKQKYTVTVSAAADVAYNLAITDSNGTAVPITFNQGAAGSTTNKRDGLVAAINSSPAAFYVYAYPTAAAAFAIEAKQSGTQFTVTESDGNLTLAATTPFVSHPVIPFGLCVALGAQDNECRLPLATSDKILGIAIFTHADQPYTGLPGYKPQSAVSVCRRGVVIVRPETAVAAEDPVFVRAVATGTERAGALRNSADGTDTIELPASKFLTTASAGQLAFVAIDVGPQGIPST